MVPAVSAEVRLYDHLFSKADPENVAAGGNYKDYLNPDSCEVVDGCWVEPSLAGAPAGYVCQFERQGYFCVDPDSRDGRPVFNRTVTLRDAWARAQSRT